MSTKENQKIYKEIGKRLRDLRDRAGLTQAQVASLLNIPRETISYYEHGVREIGIDDLLKFASIYGVDLQFFLMDLEEKEEAAEETRLSMAFRAKGIDKDDLPVIAQAQQILNNLYRLTTLLDGA